MIPGYKRHSLDEFSSEPKRFRTQSHTQRIGFLLQIKISIIYVKGIIYSNVLLNIFLIADLKGQQFQCSQYIKF